jgi:hypothetical protein
VILMGILIAFTYNRMLQRRGGAAVVLRRLRRPAWLAFHVGANLVALGFIARRVGSSHASMIVLAVDALIGYAAEIVTLISVACWDRRRPL